MRKPNTTTCGKCGGNTTPFTTYFNATTAESYALCANCRSSQGIDNLTDLASIDEHIAAYEKNLKDLEELIKDAGEMDVPPELAAFAFTPMNMYKSAQMSLAALRARRLEVLNTGENEERLQYELDKKIDEEKYEEAQQIHQKLDALKANPSQRKKQDHSPKKRPSSSLFTSEESAVGRCVRCDERFPKPRGLFQQYDFDNIHQLCLPCCAQVIPQHVDSVAMAEKMIAEMHKFSKMMNGMSLLGKLMTEEAEAVDIGGEKAKLAATIHPESQLMIDSLEARKAFLLDPSQTTAAAADTQDWEQLIGEATGNDPDLLKMLLHSLDKATGKKGATAPKKKNKKALQIRQKTLTDKDFISRAVAWTFAEKEQETCPKCQKRPVKPPIIFEDYDLGDCHKVCLVCSIVKLPLLADNLEIVAALMKEMQGISDALDELIVMTDTYNQKGEAAAKKIDKETVKSMDVPAKTPEQVIARKVIEGLQHRKVFLEGIGEEDELRDLADMFIRLLRKDD